MNIEQRIIEALTARYPEALQVTQLANAIKCLPGSVQSLLPGMVKTGKVICIKSKYSRFGSYKLNKIAEQQNESRPLSKMQFCGSVFTPAAK